jgi:hypothetical protein
MSSQSFETIMINIQQQYEQIAAMTSATYNRDLVIQSLNIVSEFFNLPREQMLKVLTIFYKILSTTAGSIFLKTNRNLTNTMVLKAKEFMDKLPEPINNDTSIELARAICKFSRVNEDVFLDHGISYTLYYGYGEDEEEEHNEDYEDEEEEDEEYDMAAYEEYEYDENEEEEEDVIEEREKQFWKNRMILVLEQLVRRNDPFYQAAISCIKQQNEKVQEDKERQRFFRDILRRELETGNEIVDSHYFKTDYKLVEMFTRKKVVDEDSKKFGCSVCVVYGWSAANIMIFDGTYTYEYEIITDTQILVDELKEEIRKDTKQCLYDTKLVCKDIAGLISSYVC